MKPKHPVVKRVQAVTRGRSVKKFAGKGMGKNAGITSWKLPHSKNHPRNVLAKTIKSLRASPTFSSRLKAAIRAGAANIYGKKARKQPSKIKAKVSSYIKTNKGYSEHRGSSSRKQKAILLKNNRYINRQYGPLSFHRGLKSGQPNEKAWGKFRESLKR